MIQLNDIKPIIDQVIEIRKERVKKRRKSVIDIPGLNSYPTDYFPGYTDYCNWREAITNHTVYGKVPYKLLQVKAPNQSDQELDYVIANYKQITLPVGFEFLSTIGRGLHDSNWSIQYEEDKAEYISAKMTFKQYLEQDIASTPLRMSYDDWIKFVLPAVKINDSMGVIAFKPFRPEKLVLVDGEMVVAGDALPEPIPVYYSCDRVLSDIDWGYLLVETNRFSKVRDHTNKEVFKGLVFELYDENTIYTIEQTGDIKDWLFEYKVYFKHDLGYIPATYLKGTAGYFDDGSLYYQSPFLLVADILDEALLDGCNLRSVKAASVYPQKVALGNDCQFQDENFNKCRDGLVLNKDGVGFYRCTECHGTGMAQRTSPLNTLLVRGKSSLDDGDNIKPVDALAYISPSTETPVFLRNEIQQGIMNAMSILHLKTTNTIVQPTAADTTATGMVMDEKGKYAFIKSVVDQVFEIYEFGMKCIGSMRYGKDFTSPTVQRPISYDFNTEGDYLQAISAAQAAGAPPVVIASYVYKYMKAIFYDNPKTARAYDLVIAADRLFTMSKADILAEIPRNLVQPWEVVLHDSAMTFIAKLQRENEKFLDQEMPVMIDQLVALAKLNTPNAPVVNARPSVTDILANANG